MTDANGAFSFLYVPPPSGTAYDLAIAAAGAATQIRSGVIAFGPNDTSAALGDILIANTTSDPNNCGACGLSCGNGACVNSVCQAGPACPAGLSDCGTGACVNVMTDVQHCGACNNVCGAGGFCANGSCVSICGDGIVSAPLEQCDDGNLASGDGCSASCQVEVFVCGNGIVEGNEQCDNGSINGLGACTFACRFNTCGDGIINPMTETCDDGNSNNLDACTNACRMNVCGDGVIYQGIEECDDGNLAATDACTNSCAVASCGDGIVRVGVEACDDGNMASGDGCSASCQVENAQASAASLATLFRSGQHSPQLRARE